MNNKHIVIEEVYGGFDVIITHGGQQATLFIQDKEQAIMVGEQIITIAKAKKIDINSATAIFNQGSGMFANE